MTGPVLVTGASGFVGGRIVHRLVAGGRPVVATVRSGSDDRRLRSLGVATRRADLGDADALARACAGTVAVVHAAGLTRARSDEELWEANAAGTERIAHAALRAGVGRFVHVSSLAARGHDGASGPATGYGRSKLESERRLRELAPDGWATALRPAAVYGPGDRDLLPLFRAARFGILPTPPGDLLIQPVYADDLAELVDRALDVPEPPGFGPWPVAGSRAYRWREAARAFAQAVDRPRLRVVALPPVVFRFAAYGAESVAWLTRRAPTLDLRRAQDLAQRTYTCDPAGTGRAFSWTPATPLPEGAARTAAWYRSEGWI